ncbi:uncharacterized protein LY79DRAFT_165009 [Colletotrichum navitas]|uniref:Uncharacterized protein n=1 Tax=Colletotrichum navitas TaxID=681940 RepID=A0AAD8V623_9PEZI|nr:uncharacterized protein LY79DRAFT_165009 [Colletotrichum navitas]KAK1593958.1 hypothetical protein LY79DRAFT_165009 [Colletotrichum navitas]
MYNNFPPDTYDTKESKAAAAAAAAAALITGYLCRGVSCRRRPCFALLCFTHPLTCLTLDCHSRLLLRLATIGSIHSIAQPSPHSLSLTHSPCSRHSPSSLTLTLPIFPFRSFISFFPQPAQVRRRSPKSFISLSFFCFSPSPICLLAQRGSRVNLSLRQGYSTAKPHTASARFAPRVSSSRPPKFYLYFLNPHGAVFLGTSSLPLTRPYLFLSFSHSLFPFL